MAETKTQRQLTWRDKVEKSLPLNDYDRIKRDAEILTLRRIRDNQEDQKLREERLVIDSNKFDDFGLKDLSDEALIPQVKKETKA